MTENRKTTELGKILRKLRIDRDEKLLDMAKRLQQTSSFVSAVEFGKRPAPEQFVASIIDVYSLDGEDADALRAAADRSRTAFTIKPRDVAGRDLAGMLARRFDTLTEDQRLDIQKILKRE